MGSLDADNVAAALGRFEPTGWTPIERALRTAEDAFGAGEGGINRVILVSDGIETCDGDPVAAARALDEAGVSVTTDVVGFDVPRQADKELLRRIAQAGGGEYADAQTGADLRDFFAQLVEQRQQLTGAYTCLSQDFYSVYRCQNDLYGAAYGEMNGLEAEAFGDGDEAGSEEIARLKDAVLEEGERRKETTLEQQEQALDEIQAEIDEIGQRLEDQEGG